MADYQPITDADLAPAAPPPSLPAGYAPIKDGDLEGQSATPMRGMKGMPTYPQAVLDRIAKGDPITRIIGNTVQKAGKGFYQTFASLMAKDQQDMINAGMKPGDFHSLGGALRFGSSVLVGGAAMLKDGFLATGPAITEGASGFGEQTGRELGLSETEAQRLGREFGMDTEAVMADVGDQASLAAMAPAREMAPGPVAPETAMSPDAINTQLASGSSYAHAYRLDPTPTGGLKDTPLGPLPTVEQAADQAKTVAAHFGLPDGAAAAVERTYAEKGISPAEVFADAHDPANGVLADVAAGEVPRAYPEIAGRQAAMAEAPAAEGATAPASASAAEEPAPGAAPELPVSGVEPSPTRPQGGLRPIQGTGEVKTPLLAQKIEAGAVEKGLTESFGDLPEFKSLNFADQARKIAAIDPQTAIDIAMGRKAAPQGIVPELVLKAVEVRALATSDVGLLRDLATQSGLVKQSVTIAQRLRALGERDPTNPVAALQDVQAAREAALKARGVDAATQADQFVRQETSTLQAVKQATRSKVPVWEQFMQSIKC